MLGPANHLQFSAKPAVFLSRTLRFSFADSIQARETTLMKIFSMGVDKAEELWPRPAMKLVGPLAARSPGLGLLLVLALEVKRHRSADQFLQSRLIDLFAFVDVDGAPDIPLQAGVE